MQAGGDAHVLQGWRDSRYLLERVIAGVLHALRVWGRGDYES